MQIRQSRLLVLTVVAGAIALIAALPALAATSSQKAASVKVSITKTKEFAFTVSPKSVAHGPITFTISNGGMLPHDFELCAKPSTAATATTCAGKKTTLISPGQTAKLTVTVAKAGSYQYLCTVPAHAAAGMKGLLKVT
jgi:nitrite reductase (NO-forming)